jgi:hypothetical protein
MQMEHIHWFSGKNNDCLSEMGYVLRRRFETREWEAERYVMRIAC